MHRIKIVTDSTCDLPKDILNTYDITVLPLTVRFGKENFRDGVDITTEEFFEKLGKTKEMPSTSQVSVGEFIEAFEELSQGGETVLGLFLSARLSGTYQSAVIAKNVLGLDNVFVMDTKLATLAHGMVVFEAARMAKDGKPLEDIMERVQYMANNTKSLIVLGSLSYLEKGGRISTGTAFMGNLLNIMPVVTFVDGEVKFLGKVRGRKRLVNWLTKYIEDLGIDVLCGRIGINYIGKNEIVKELKRALEDRFDAGEFVEGVVGSVIGTYSGPGMALGIYFIK